MSILIYYLITLFYKSGCKYSCTTLKLARLLTIYILCSLQDNEDLIKCCYIDQKHISLIKTSSLTDIGNEVYRRFQYEDNNQEYLGNFDSDIEIPSMFQKPKQYWNKYLESLQVILLI